MKYVAYVVIFLVVMIGGHWLFKLIGVPDMDKIVFMFALWASMYGPDMFNKWRRK